MVRNGVKVKTNGSTVDIDVLVERVGALGTLQGLLLVTFRPTAMSATALATDPMIASAPLPRRRRRVADLERELLETRASLQSTIKELEESNEELTSAKLSAAAHMACSVPAGRPGAGASSTTFW